MPSTVPTDRRRPLSTDDRPPRPLPRRIDARTLLGDEQLLMIEHGESRYFLRMTRNNKLILTK